MSHEISKENRLKIEDICNRFNNVECCFIDVGKKEVLYSKKSSLDFSTFGRLFIGSLIKEDISKILYIDCDTLVLGSLKELWSLNIEGHVVAGVQDIRYSSIIDHGLENKAIYLNSGVLLINFKKWAKLEKNFISFIEGVDDLDAILHDQGVINAVVDDDKKLLIKPYWNLMYSFYRPRQLKKLLNFYKAPYLDFYSDVIDDAIGNPVVVHDKFWDKGYNNEIFVERYEEYVSMSPFEHDEIFTGDTRIKQTFNARIFFMLPNFMYPMLRKLFLLYKLCF